MKAVHKLKQLTWTRHTAKCSSRDYDADVIDIRETMVFNKLGDYVPETETAGEIHFDVRAKNGAMRSTNKLAFGSIDLDFELKSQAISRFGEWSALDVPLFDESYADYSVRMKRATRRHRAESKSDKMLRTQVGSAQLKVCLSWTDTVDE